MPPSLTPGSSSIVSVQNTDVDIGLRHGPRDSALPTSRNPFRAGHGFRGYAGSLLLRPVRLLAPLYGPDRSLGQTGAFTSRLSTGRSSFPLLDMTTTVTGLLCWRDFHP